MTTEELKKLEATLWQSADTLRANSDLKSSEYSTPVPPQARYEYLLNLPEKEDIATALVN